MKLDKRSHLGLAGRAARADDQDGALRHVRIALTYDPHDAKLWNDYGRLLSALQEYDAACACSKKAIDLCPNDAELWSNHGNHLWLAERQEDCGRALDRSLELEPGNRHAVWHKGLSLYETSSDCIDYLRKAYELNPGNADVKWDLGLSLLIDGHYEEGYRLYEARYERPPMKYDQRIPVPDWEGQDLEGKSIVVGHEQGYGDIIQYARYIPLLKERTKAEVTFLVQKELERLLDPCLRNYCKVVGHGIETTFTKPDYKLSAMSLPFRMDTPGMLKPVAFPYIIAPTKSPTIEAWPGTKKRIGISWAGSTAHAYDRWRSAEITDFLQLAEIEGAQLFSFQKGERSGDIQKHRVDGIITELGPDLVDFADAAGALEQMDIFVSIDTALLHLAGAMGIPTVALIRTRHPDWRWGRKGTKTEWYPSMRIARNRGDWRATIMGVRDFIADLPIDASLEKFMSAEIRGQRD